MFRPQRAAAGPAAIVLCALLACAEGGQNANKKNPGNQPGGVALGIGDIAVAPVGDYVLFKRDEKLSAGFAKSGKIVDLPVNEPTRLAFSKQRPAVYVASTATGSELVSLDVADQRVLWRAAIADASTEKLRLEVADDDRHVVAASGFEVQTFDAATGAGSGSFSLDIGVVDVEILPDQKRVLVVEQHSWIDETPNTRVVVFDLETKLTTSLSVPNCADDIAISADGRYGLLAPTTCSKDPISVIDLTAGSEKFVRNLPGFGPIALAPDGTTAVGFLDRDNLDLSLFDDPEQAPVDAFDRYHLMLIDTTDLSYEFAGVGDDLPRYAITPNGNVLLVDSVFLLDQRVRLFDVQTRSFREIAGPSLTLDHFTLSSDSKHAYVLDAGLWDIDIPDARAKEIELPFSPTHLNISPDDQLLFLRKTDSEICIFDLATRSCARHFVSITPG